MISVNILNEQDLDKALLSALDGVIVLSKEQEETDERAVSSFA